MKSEEEETEETIEEIMAPSPMMVIRTIGSSGRRPAITIPHEFVTKFNIEPKQQVRIIINNILILLPPSENLFINVPDLRTELNRLLDYLEAIQES